MMGSLRLRMECGLEFDCGSGLTDDLRRNWQPPVGAIVVYRFQELSADNNPRFVSFPSLLSFNQPD